MNDQPTVDWKARALSHATVVRALLSVRDPEPGTAGAMWLELANETLKLAGFTPGVGAAQK